MIAVRSPKVFGAAVLAPPVGAVATPGDIGRAVEFWLEGHAAGARGHLIDVFEDMPSLAFDGPVGVVHVVRIGSFAMPLTCIHLLPADSSLEAGILPPSGPSPRGPDGGHSSRGGDDA